jgi:hypothetical protein
MKPTKISYEINIIPKEITKGPSRFGFQTNIGYKKTY